MFFERGDVMHLASLTALFSGCGVPVMVAALSVIGVWLIYAATVRRK